MIDHLEHLQFMQDMQTALSQSPKSISPKYFYDQAGSALFDRIFQQFKNGRAHMGRTGATFGNRIHPFRKGLAVEQLFRVWRGLHHVSCFNT